MTEFRYNKATGEIEQVEERPSPMTFTLNPPSPNLIALQEMLERHRRELLELCFKDLPRF